MSPLQRFDNLSDDRRAAILQAAAEEFSLHGFDGASFARIIERSGLSKGAMYYYFENKEDLYRTVLLQAIGPLVTLWESVPQAQTAAEFWAGLADLLRRSFRFYEENPLAMGLGKSLVRLMTSGQHNAPVAELRAKAEQWTRDFFRRGRAVGALRTDLPEELLVPMILKMDEAMDAWFVEHWGEMEPAEMERIGGLLLDLVRRVLEPPRAAQEVS